MRLRPLLCLSLGVLGVVPSVVAQPREPALAQALFDDARRLMQQGQVSAACPKLEESQRLDPGIGTQFHLASCYEQAGKLASAWAGFLAVASAARAAEQTERETLADFRAVQLEPRVPKVLVSVPHTAQAAGLELRWDGMLLASVAWGIAMPVDPGAHELTATAPGNLKAAHQIEAVEGHSSQFELPLLVDEPVVALKPEVQVKPQPQPSVAVRHNKGSSADADFMPFIVTAFSAAGLGLGLSGVFAGLASQDNTLSKRDCRAADPNLCQAQGVALRDRAIKRGNVATLMAALGGACGAVGVALWWLEPEARSRVGGKLDLGVSVEVSTRAAGVRVRGTF